jgi:hypothetical protein
VLEFLQYLAARGIRQGPEHARDRFHFMIV